MLRGVIRAAKSSYRSLRAGLALFLVVVGGRSAAQVTFTWSSGTPPVTSVIFGDILDITTVANHDFNATALSNSGTVNWQAGHLRSGSAGSITNHNVWNDTASNALNNDFGGTAWSFINTATGTYHKAASGTTNFGVPFQNDGTVSATAGTLTIAAGGSSNSGTFTAAAGSVVDFTSNYTLAGAITFGGAGMVQLSAGTLGGTATLSGPLTWTAGSIAGLTFGPTSVLTISSGANHDFNASAWINHGTVDWTGGQLRSGSAGSITNHATWNDTASNSLNNAYGGTAWTFTNTATGTYFKAGPGTTTVSVPFFNQGAINATAGSLAIAAGGTSTGGQFITANGANIDFTGGYHLVGTVTFSGTGTTQLSGGTLTGPATIEGPFTWLAGSIADLTFGTTAVLTIGSAAVHDFNASAWTNNGTVNWTDGQIRSGSAGSITNHAAWNDTASNSLNNAFGGTAWSFINTVGATYNKAAAGTTTVSVPFFNQGMVNVTAGSLAIAAGGTSTGGQFITASGASTDFTNGYHLDGTVTFSGIGTAQLSGGTLTGPAVVEGPFTWLAGSISNLTFGTTAVLTISSAAVHDFNATTWTNNGTVNWTDGQIRSGSSGSITNHAAWNDTASNSLNNAFGGTAWSFINTVGATYNKAAAGTTTFSVPFYNLGAVNITAGTLDLAGGGTSTDSTYTVAAGAALTISTNYAIAGTVTFAGPGLSQFAAGTLTGSGTIQGPISWTGGNLSAPPVFGSASILTISGAADHDFNATGWTTDGIVNWTGGALRSGSAGSITNHGTWDVTAASSMNNAFGGTAWTFANAAGAFFKKHDTGTTSIAVPFNTAGTLAVETGVLSFTSTLTLQSVGVLEFSLGGTARGTTFGAIDVTGPLVLDGALALRFADNFENVAVNTDTLTLLTSSSGALTGGFTNVVNGGVLTALDGFGSFQVNFGSGSIFGANSIVLSNFTAVPEPGTWGLLVTGLGLLAFVTRCSRRRSDRR